MENSKTGTGKLPVQEQALHAAVVRDRKKRGLTWPEYAQHLNVTISTLQKMKHGGRVSARTLDKVYVGMATPTRPGLRSGAAAFP